MKAYAVYNHAIDQQIAIFAHEEAANAYAEGFTQCDVFAVEIPDALFAAELDEDETPRIKLEGKLGGWQ